MKRLAIVLMTFLAAFSVVQAQYAIAEKGKAQDAKKETKTTNRAPLKKLSGDEISVVSKDSFVTNFGYIPDVKWIRSENFDEATFVKNGSTMTAYFDSDGTLVGTTSLKKFSELPSKGQEEIKTRYKDYAIGPVIFFDDNDLNDSDMVLWSSQFDDEDLYFVELNKGASRIIVRITPAGFVSLFKEL